MKGYYSKEHKIVSLDIKYTNNIYFYIKQIQVFLPTLKELINVTFYHMVTVVYIVGLRPVTLLELSSCVSPFNPPTNPGCCCYYC